MNEKLKEQPEVDWGKFALYAGIALLALGVILILGGLWWWAAFDMSGKVGAAIAGTVFVFFVIGAICTLTQLEDS
jgi:hypothetical protein